MPVAEEKAVGRERSVAVVVEHIGKQLNHLTTLMEGVEPGLDDEILAAGAALRSEAVNEDVASLALLALTSQQY